MMDISINVSTLTVTLGRYITLTQNIRLRSTDMKAKEITSQI